MIKPKLYIDFDGCLVDTISAIVSIYNEDYCAYKKFKPIKPEDINTWNFEECNCASDSSINQYFNTPRFFERLEFMPNAKTIIWLLSYNYDISIVSHGYSPNLKLKEIWIKEHLPSCINFIGVNLKEHDDKSCVDMSDGIFIEDNTKNLHSSNAFKKIVYGKSYPWNKDDAGFIRCYDWIDIYHVIENMEGK